jgi:hypothetical protein
VEGRHRGEYLRTGAEFPLGSLLDLAGEKKGPSRRRRGGLGLAMVAAPGLRVVRQRHARLDTREDARTGGLPSFEESHR